LRYANACGGRIAPPCYAFASVSPAASQTEIIFYDGHCALCHGAVKFVLKHDRSGNAFRFAPLQGATFQSRVPPGRRASLPDSVIVLTEDGTLHKFVNVYVDDDDVRYLDQLDTKVADGDTVSILPAVAGG